MRTKTLLLTALLGALGSVAVNAQTNVYSLNAVGYINVTCYADSWNIISCPLLVTGGNTIANLLPNASGAYKRVQIYNYTPTSSNPYAEDIGTATGWEDGGTNTINPGQAVWFYNPWSTNITVTFVGTVPTGPISTPLYPSSFNLVSTAVPASGDIVTNSIMNFTNASKHDQVYSYTPTNANPYVEYVAGANGTFPLGDPILPTVGGGLWYYNSTTNINYWAENFQL